jgi:hypothetical protein
VITPEVREWLHLLRKEDRRTLLLIAAALDELSESGPGLGRPLVDTVTGASISNMKELRPGSAGRSEIRMLFVFDPWRQAVVLVAGDKRDSWRSWYRHAIPLAERRYGRHLEESGR